MNAFQRAPERLPLPLSADGYALANEAFRQCWTADRAEVLAFLNRRLPANSAAPLRVLGIGVGDGSFDVEIIALLRAAFPASEIDYTAVEPNEAMLRRFVQRIEADPASGVRLSAHALCAEDYQAEGSFDLIHYIHSLYHMPESEERLLRESLAWLRPGGRLLIALSSERGGIYQLMGRFWDRIDYSFFTSGLFGQESLRAVLSKISAPYASEIYPEVAIDVSACFTPGSALGRHLLNFLLQADMDHAPADLRRDALDALDELSYSDGARHLLPHPSGVFVVGA